MVNVAFTAPHNKASETGLAVLKEGGSAVDAMIAAAAMIAVQYPHMNSLGGDSFWLIQRAGEKPIAIDGAGYAAQKATPGYYTNKRCDTIPARGADAALCVAGTLAAWHQARASITPYTTPLPLKTLLSPAIDAARQGITVTESLAMAVVKCEKDFANFTALKKLFYPENRGLTQGQTFCNQGLAHLLESLADKGLEDFYRGEISEVVASSLAEQGSPIGKEDLQEFYAQTQEPLSVDTSYGTLFNLGAPTQGVASLLILAIYDQLYDSKWTESERVHALIEATKQAFIVRDNEVADPSVLSKLWPNILKPSHIETLASKVSMDKALPWPQPAEPGDTVWMGALDKDGTMVSFIQSIYWEFGSGLVIPEFGLVWNNRGSSFLLDPQQRKALRPRTKPFHTLNPASAILNDGSCMVYGTMGGEGQPQTQSALFSRHIFDNINLQEAISDGRWLLGRTWGEMSTDLKMEEALYTRIGQALESQGHKISVVKQSEQLGHAGGIRVFKDGNVECATDPRSDGAALVATL